MLKSLQELWDNAKTPTEYIIVMWIYLLFGLFTISWTSLILGIVTGQVDLSNSTFGVFDTLGS